MTESQTNMIASVTSLVAIGICTFRRPALIATLQSLSRQTPVPGHRFCIIIADNDDGPSAADRVAAAAASLPFPLHYVHAPARNISIARNALLQRATDLGASHLAMIDDDEIAAPGWAQALLAEMAQSRADAVLGPVLGRYRPDAPRWMQQARLHDVLPVIRADGRIHTGYSGNLLLRLSSPAVQGRRFDLAFGRTGGEDDVFLSGLVRDGGRIAYSPEAVAEEDVPAARESLIFLMRRNFRSGQTHARINAPPHRMGRATMFAKATAKIAFLIASAAATALSPARRTRALLRASLHAGVCAQLSGKRTLELYNA